MGYRHIRQRILFLGPLAEAKPIQARLPRIAARVGVAGLRLRGEDGGSGAALCAAAVLHQALHLHSGELLGCAVGPVDRRGAAGKVVSDGGRV